MLRTPALPVALLATLSLAACETYEGRRAVQGGAIGAAGGAVAGELISGDPLAGAAIGAAAGAIIGASTGRDERGEYWDRDDRRYYRDRDGRYYYYDRDGRRRYR